MQPSVTITSEEGMKLLKLFLQLCKRVYEVGYWKGYKDGINGEISV